MRQSEWLYCIPSYKRCGRQKTIEYLLSIGCDKERIIVSTQTESDYSEYCREYSKIVGRIIYGKGDRVSVNRNNLLNYVQTGMKLVLLEDDINSVSRLVEENGKKRLEKVKTIQELDELVLYGFRLAELNGTICFGLNMTANPFFMKRGYTKKRLVHTGFMGIVNTDLRFDENMKVWDDPEMNCQIIKKYGSVISINDYCADIDRFVKGGCSEALGDKKSVDETRRYLLNKHGDLLTLNTKGLFCLRRDAVKALGL